MHETVERGVGTTTMRSFRHPNYGSWHPNYVLLERLRRWGGEGSRRRWGGYNGYPFATFPGKLPGYHLLLVLVLVHVPWYVLLDFFNGSYIVFVDFQVFSLAQLVAGSCSSSSSRCSRTGRAVDARIRPPEELLH